MKTCFALALAGRNQSGIHADGDSCVISGIFHSCGQRNNGPAGIFCVPHCIWAQCSAIVPNQIISVDLGSLTQALKQSRGQVGYQLWRLGSCRNGKICLLCVKLLHSCKGEVKWWRFSSNKKVVWKINVGKFLWTCILQQTNGWQWVASCFYSLSIYLRHSMPKHCSSFTVVWLCKSSEKLQKKIASMQLMNRLTSVN